ncbi:hypothetical protein TELCIR_15740 [Teladorsagia circumcincta]|uniref:Uncharacterized protein n=1 Tax=Teladorsagia circumcincta TaxID=45464 RepID=A0A2G9TXC5_TELCI|nr:hypothetical protein TELCIR_15740 [Teladorsagia circumcincta]
MVAYPPQQAQQPVLQQQQQQQYFRFKQFPQQFQSAEVAQQFSPPNTVNTQFQPPNVVQQVNKEKFLRSETPRIYDQQFRIQTLTQNEINVQQAQQGESRLPVQQRSLPEAYGPEEKFTDGHHPSYIEDTAKTTPAEQFRRMIQQPRQPQAKRIKTI